MISTTPGAATTALLEGAPAGTVITARLVDGDETLPTVVTVAPKLDAEGDPLDAFVGSFVAPANLPYQIEWVEAGSVVGTELIVLGQTDVEGFAGYPTTGELVAASSVSELLVLSGPQQDALRDVAIADIERFCGQQFTTYVGDLVVDGGGGREVFPPKRVEVLTAIVVKGTSIDLTDVVVSERGDRIHFLPLSTDYAVMAMRETAYDSRTFRSGSGTVILTGTFGWSVVPAPVVQAIRIEMEQQALADASPLSGIVGSSRRLGLRNISQGNLRAEVGDPSVVSPQAARLLDPAYVWLGPGGYLA